MILMMKIIRITIGLIFCGGILPNCIPGCSVKRFKYLIRLAEMVLVMPHSNAELERFFSIVRKSKTLERSSLKLDGTLSSIFAVKTMYPESNCPCF